MKVIKQHDAKDCGAACLASILSSYGTKMPISKVREVVKTDKKGTTVYGLVEGAKSLGFTAKGLKGTPDALTNDIPLPAIVHVVVGEGTFLHYMVLYKVTKKHFILMDPAKGKVKYKKEDFFKIWTGIIVFLKPTVTYEKKNEKKGTLSRFFKLIFNQKKLIGTVFVMSLVLTLIGILTSFYFKIIMDEVIPNGLTTSLHSVSLVFLGLYIVKELISFFRSHVLLYLSRRIDIPLILGYYNHVIDLPLEFYTSRKVGEIISRFNDAGSIKSAISNVTLTMMLDTLLIIGGGFVLYLINSDLFMITILMTILYAIISVTFIRPFKRRNRESMEKGAKLTSYLVESLQGAETIKTFNSEEHIKYETDTLYIDALDTGFKLGVLGNTQGFLKSLVASIGGLTITWYGVSMVLSNVITIGELLTFNALLAYFLGPLRNVIDLQSSLQTAFVSADRLSEIMDLDKEDKTQSLKLSKIDSIKFEDVSFRYGARKLVLEDIDLTINKGETIALVGETGSGKTTLAKLVMNLYDIEKGSIKVDGIDVKDINKESLRSKIAYIPQEIFLFSGTVIDNLTLGVDIESDELIEMVKKYEVDKLIEGIPGRYEGIIEEKGANLSGGQKQRLAIIRALLKKPELLIMDEATSNLDTITERNILKVLDEEHITKLVIAHRLSTIKRSNKIIVLKDGKILEVGTHKELLKLKGEYFKMWKSTESIGEDE